MRGVHCPQCLGYRNNTVFAGIRIVYERALSMKTQKKILNIAMLGHKRIPSREGGIEIVVEELSTRMVKRGHRVTCYNRKGHHVSGSEFDGKHLAEYKGVQLKPVWTIDRKGLAAMTASLSGAIKAVFGKYDVVHFHAEGPCAMLWLPKLFGKRCIATIHGIDWQRAKWGGFASKYIKFGEKVAVKHADEIIVLSGGVQKYFKDTYDRETVFIPNGVNRPEIREAKLIKEKFGLDKDSYILFLGRIVPEKGVSYLIEAFKQINTDKKLVIAGGTLDSPEYAEKIKEMVKGDDRIIMTGFVTGRALQELYSNALLYVLPSAVEGMPLSLLEAMSYGLACVTSDIPECAEVLDGNGVTFPHGDVGALRQVLQELVMDPLRIYDLGRSASRHVGIHYNWDSVTVRTLAVYEEALT